MKIDMTGDQPRIDASDLAQLLGLTPAEVQAKMRDGEITSKLETGQGEDAGRMRLTFFHEGKRVRLTCCDEGTVLKTLRTTTGAR